MTDIFDAYESSYTIMLNLSRSWILKQGDFFVESPIILLTSIIWFLKIYEDTKYCTFPHAIELLNKKIFRRFYDTDLISRSYNLSFSFHGCVAGRSARPVAGADSIGKNSIVTDDFSLDINNLKEPKILCVGNSPDRQNIYWPALGFYNLRIVKFINKKDKLKSSVIIDELPTIYFRGLDNLIATARSNKVAVCLGFQDYSQLIRDYGDKESKVIQNTVGNIFSGQVVGETAKNLSERFGKVAQK